MENHKYDYKPLEIKYFNIKLNIDHFASWSDRKINNNLISERSAIISSYALCGFANFGSIGIQLGGIGAMAPEKRNILSKIVLKAMVGGALASWLTATIAGILI